MEFKSAKGRFTFKLLYKSTYNYIYKFDGELCNVGSAYKTIDVQLCIAIAIFVTLCLIIGTIFREAVAYALSCVCLKNLRLHEAKARGGSHTPRRWSVYAS